MGAEADSGARSRLRMGRVTMAVWVTLMGIMVFFTGTSKTICAASALDREGQQVSMRCDGNALTVTQDVELCE